MNYNHLKKINIFNLSVKDYYLRNLEKAYNELFERSDYTGVKPHIEIYLITIKRDLPLSILAHRTSRILDSSKYETTFSSCVDGFNIYLTCFEGFDDEYLSWLACKCFKYIEVLLNKENYSFIEIKDELAQKRVKPQKEAGVCNRQWKKDGKDSLSIDIITSQFAKDMTGKHYNKKWKLETLSKFFDDSQYKPNLIKTKEGLNLMKTLDIYEIHLVENYKKVFFKKYYELFNYHEDELWLRDKAWRMFKFGGFKNSLELFEKLCKLNPHNEEYYRLKAINKFYLKDFQGSIEAANKAIFNDSNKAESWYIKSNCFYKLGNFDKAISCIDKAIELEEDNYFYFCLKGMSYFNQKKYRSALESFSKSLKLNPQQAKSWCLKGYSELYTLEFEKAMKSFDKSLSVKSNYVDAILGKAFIYKRQEKYSEALEYFNKLQKMKPDDDFISKSIRECILAINKAPQKTK